VTDSRPPARPLEGKRICLVFDFVLSHYGRLLMEIDGLRSAGAQVTLLTPNPVAPAGLDVVYAPLEPSARLLRPLTGPSRLRLRPLRMASDAGRGLARFFAVRAAARFAAARRARKLRTIANCFDIMWVIDYPRLGEVLRASRGRRARVVYETVDLVPEYLYEGEAHRRASLAGEARLIGQIDGFVTACDSYADYYVERYGHAGLARRPTVRDNMPAEIADRIKPAEPPLRLLFFGSLLPDRPVFELIEAVAATTADVTLTLQGLNYLKPAAAALLDDRIARADLRSRVHVVDPCPPEAIVETAAAYDVGIVALRGDDENERRASTAKLFTYMAAGLAVLGSDLPGIARIVRSHGNGLLVQDMDSDSWAAAIDRLGAMTTAEIDAMKERSLAAANLYAWERQRPVFVAEFVRALEGRDAEA
jgi:glycosyltransferase involved in cell wall biosynthesis